MSAVRLDARAFVAFAIVAAGVAVGWAAGNWITRKVGLT